MKLEFLWVVVVAIVLLYAIHLGRGVKLNVTLPGTGASLEVSDGRHAGRPEALSPEPAVADDDATNSGRESE